MLLWSYIGEGGFRCSLNLSPEVLEDSPMYSSSQSTLLHMVSIDDSALLLDWIFVFGRHQEVLDGGASFKVHFCPKSSANVLDALTKSTVIGNHYVCTGFLCRSLAGVLFLCFHLYPVESPGGVFTFLECTLQMLFFFLQQLWIGADGLCSVLPGTNHVVFRC